MVSLKVLQKEGPRIFEIDNFLNSTEAEHLIKMAKSNAGLFLLPGWILVLGSWSLVLVFLVLGSLCSAGSCATCNTERWM